MSLILQKEKAIAILRRSLSIWDGIKLMSQGSSKILHTVWSWGFIHKENLFEAELVLSMVIRVIWRMESSFYKGGQKFVCLLKKNNLRRRLWL